MDKLRLCRPYANIVYEGTNIHYLIVASRVTFSNEFSWL